MSWPLRSTQVNSSRPTMAPAKPATACTMQKGFEDAALFGLHAAAKKFAVRHQRILRPQHAQLPGRNAGWLDGLLPGQERHPPLW
ncbi:MAG: hypothetical protein ACWA6Y_09650 [Polaromonas sp.]